jgi:hypothetical protein
MRYLSFILIAIITLFSLPAPAAAPEKQSLVQTDEAQRLYQAYGDAVYQVQVIDVTSGKKTSIGSGFQFTEDGLIATNYHVVAEALQHAGNRIEYLHDKGDKNAEKETGPLKVVIADVVHDLAIVKLTTPGRTWLKLGTSQIPKGTKLFSLGNPHDLGFTIIEGTFNGYSKESFIDQIHFSGALNPGMSGGPAIGHDGAVVGVNVATAGNQISFLVPVESLQALYGEAMKLGPSYNFIDHVNDHIQEQLLANQDHVIKMLLRRKWESMNFGPVTVPGHIHDVLKCWGGINHKEKDPFEYYFSMCSGQDRIFLDNDFDTSLILYRYNYIVGKKNLNLLRFYNYYQGQYSFPSGDYQNAKEGDVTNFDCNTRFVDIAGYRWKSNFCVRQYKKYPKIFDMHLYMAIVGAGKKGFSLALVAQGVSKENALALVQKFVSEIKPNAPANNNASAPKKNPA